MEIDEKDHQDRDISREIERQRALEKKLGCKFIRINPDKKKNIFKAQNEILRHIKELECLKTSICLKHVAYIIKMKLKTYCLACRKHTSNIASRKVTMTNKVIRDKSRCGECFPDKSRFLKEKYKELLVL